MGRARARFQIPFCCILPIPIHLLIAAHSLLLAAQNYGLKFMEMALHVLQAGVNVLLLTVDALQHFFALLLSNAGTLLPLLDALGQNPIDAAGKGDSKKWNGPSQEETDEGVSI